MLTPFCVADRPMSLRILRGMDLRGYSGDVCIMIHANTSANFQNLVAEYPLEKGRCPFHNAHHGQVQCEKVESIRKRTVRMCDSGVFTKTGAPKTYEELFRVYERADVEYGIIIDYLRDPDRTLKSAREALQEFSLKPRRFELVAVAGPQRQGIPRLLCQAARHGLQPHRRRRPA